MVCTHTQKNKSVVKNPLSQKNKEKQKQDISHVENEMAVITPIVSTIILNVNGLNISEGRDCEGSYNIQRG